MGVHKILVGVHNLQVVIPKLQVGVHKLLVGVHKLLVVVHKVLVCVHKLFLLALSFTLISPLNLIFVPPSRPGEELSLSNVVKLMPTYLIDEPP